MFERFTEKAINIIAMAQKEAADSNTFMIYPEFILLGILQTKSNICSRMLVYGGMNPDNYREHVFKKYENVKHVIKHVDIAFSDKTKELIQRAFDIAQSNQNAYIMPEHLLLALIDIASNSTNSLCDDLEHFGADIEKIKTTLLKLIDKSNKKSEVHPEQEKRKIKSEYSTVQDLFKDGEAKEIELFQN